MPEAGRFASFKSFLISASVAPSKTGVATCSPSALRGPAQVRLQDLPDVHAARARRAGSARCRPASRPAGTACPPRGRMRGDDALVAVPAGHLVADGELALHGDVDLDHLDDARRQLVALLEQLDPLGVDAVQDLDLRVLAPQR